MAGNAFDATPQPQQTPNPFDATPKPRATNNPFDSVATPQPGSTQGKSLDAAAIKRLWLANKGDPKKADLWAQISLNESSGDPTRRNKDSGATGLYQILPSAHPEFKGWDLTDPVQNTRAAIILANQSGTKPWDDSKDKGAFGGWGKFANEPIVAPAAAATPQPKPTKQPNPFDTLAKPTPQPTAGQTPHPRKKDLYGQTLPNQASPMDTIFNTLDVPLMAVSALRRQQVGAAGGFDDLLTQLGTGHVNEAAQRYGLVAPEQLKEMAKHGDEGAKFFLDHPTLAGIYAGAAEFANPAQYAAGGVVGKPVEWAWGLMKNVPALRGVFNMLSPFRGIAVAGGEEGKRAMQSLAVRVASDPARAQKESIRIFGDLSPTEKQDVVHIFQGNLPATATRDPKRQAVLFSRARFLDDFVTDISERKVTAGLLDPQTAANRSKHFSLAGAFEHPAQNTAEEYVEWLEGAGSGGKRFWHGTEHTEAQYPTLAEAQGKIPGKPGSKVPLRADFDPAIQMEKWANSSLQRLDLDDALRRAPKSLIQPEPKGWSYANTPRDLAKKPMVSWDDAIKKHPELANIDSPLLKKSIVSQSFVDYMARNSTRIYNPGLTYLPDTSVKNKVLNGALHVWDHLNEYQRRAILVNPLIHPVFNLSQNAFAAGLPLHEVAGLVTKSVINSFGGGKLLDKFLPQSAKYQQALEAALRDGAIAELKRGDTRMLASRFRDLNPAQWPKKLLDEAGAWNSRATFGKYGEEAFSVALHRRLVAQGIDGKEAGGLVREALGNYQNVAQHGVDAFASRVMFFYPWLKGNMPFWVRTMVKRPQNVAAPHQAARANNLLVDDPSETDAKHPQYAKDFQWIIGDKQHGFQTVTPILPQRMLNDVFSLASADPGTIVNSALRVVQNRAVPGVKVGAQMIETAIKPAASPLDPRNFNTLFDKKAPKQEQWKKLSANIVGELAPIPVVQNAVQNGLKRGFSVSELQRSIRDRGIGTFSYDRLSKHQEQRLSSARRQFDSQVKHIPAGLDDSEKSRRLQKFYSTYSKKVHKLLDDEPAAPSPTGPSPKPGETQNAFDSP